MPPLRKIPALIQPSQPDKEQGGDASLDADSVPDIKLPQARVLKALYPGEEDRRPWLSRYKLATRAGFTEKSGTVTRALGGSDNKWVGTHLGLVALKLVEKKELDVNGTPEIVYRITDLGELALLLFLQEKEIPVVRDKEVSTNLRFKDGPPPDSEDDT